MKFNYQMSQLSAFGFYVACGISWQAGNSFLWILLHAFLSWAYVVYWLLEYTKLKDFLL